MYIGSSGQFYTVHFGRLSSADTSDASRRNAASLNSLFNLNILGQTAIVVR
jgi:hypothetical protein